jgi:hypothetical protein
MMLKMCSYNLKFLSISNSGLNLCPMEEKLIQIHVVISNTLIMHNLKEKSVISDNFHTFPPK